MSAAAPLSSFPPGLVIYQIYPRSFQDSNNDGIGDLLGIINRLDYLADLGITAIWICPIYKSPMADYGYDVSDYLAIDPSYGTMADFDTLLNAAHQRNIKVILDLVLNHTSTEHPWFQESRKSPDNPKRDWYVWKQPRSGGAPPNNWVSTFGGAAWELDPLTNEYYLHSFFKEQADLNWENPLVRAAIKNILRFWLDRGVDGFRLDAVYMYGKDPSFRDDPINPNFDARTENPYDALLHSNSEQQGSVFTHLSELANFLAGYPGRFMVTEAYPHEPFSAASYLEFYEHVNPLVAAPFNFMTMYLRWEAADFQRIIDRFQAALEPTYTPIYVYGNHDRTRLISRIGHDAARSAALLELMLPGTAVIYYGEELGMENVDIPALEVHDPLKENSPIRGVSRDVSRTPMQWDTTPNAAFSTVKPWLPIAKNFTTVNVATELAAHGSLLNLYKQLLAFRKQSEVIQHGSYTPLDLSDPELMGFVREYRGEKLAIVINFSKVSSIPLSLPGAVLLSTHAKAVDPLSLRPSEGRVIDISPTA
jgi:alpha-glucosidase